MGGHAIKIRRLPAVDPDFVNSIRLRFLAWDVNGKIYLFGSRAKNTHSYYSDYDLLFLSEKFAGMDGSARFKLILKQVRTPKSEWTLEPHCFTEAEWEARRGSLFYKEVESVKLDISKPS
jgi:predicted nucleotidyltransferase